MGQMRMKKRKERDFYKQERRDRHGIRLLPPGKGKDMDPGEIVDPTRSCEVEREAVLALLLHPGRDRRNARIRDMWLRCYSQQEIGEAEGLSRDSITDIMGEFSDLKKLPKSDLAHAEHATDFDPPIYNIWKQQEKTPGQNHFGNTEIRWLDNKSKLVYNFIYTK